MNNILFLLCMSGLIIPEVSQATCEKVTGTGYLTTAPGDSGYTATAWEGACDSCNGNAGLPSVISVSTNSSYFPSGTLLASSTVDIIQESLYAE